MAKKIPVDTQQLQAVILCQVDGMRCDKKHCDFLIKVGSEEIPVHRNIICATSDYFDAMFSHPTRENESGIIEMIGVDPECAIICVDHMYGKEVSILPEKYEPLMYVANLMQLHTLSDAVATLLEANLDPKSFFIAKRIADMYGCKKLEEKCNEFAEENFGLISKEKEFGEMDKSYIKKMIKSKNVKMLEEHKLDALFRWVKCNPDRMKFTMELIGYVNLLQVPLQRRRYLIENESLVHDDNECLLHFSISVMDSMKIGTDMGEEKAVIIFDKISGHLKSFKPGDKNLKIMPEMNGVMKNEYFSAVALDGCIYVLTQKKSVYRLEISDQTKFWERMPDMSEYHGSCPPTVSVSGCIYVLGGSRYATNNCVEKYDSARNEWIKLKTKPPLTDNSALTTMKGLIYSFGGQTSTAFTEKVMRLDPSSPTWVDLAPMGVPRGFAAAAEYNQRIYVAGGTDGNPINTVECYHPQENTWCTIKSMETERSWFRIFTVENGIYAVGGYFSAPNSVEKYNASNDDWEEVQISSGMQLRILESVVIEK